MWSDFFTNATIYGLDDGTDIISINDTLEDLKNKNNIKLYLSHDAYDEGVFKLNFLDKDVKFDLLLDDCPHSLESMIKFIKLYSQIMTDDGILIIEDVQEYEWIEILKSVVPDHLKKYIKVYDLRKNKNRWDDIVFSIDKCNI